MNGFFWLVWMNEIAVSVVDGRSKMSAQNQMINDND
jgi:hypothetical protein